MKKNQRTRKPNKNVRPHKWRRIVIATAVAIVAAIGGVVLWRVIARGSENITVMHVSVPDVTAAKFSDDNTVLFGANDIPTVNNNRAMSSIMPLTISYNWYSGPYQQVLKPTLTQSDITNGIKITPTVRGAFRTQGGGDEIVFTPRL